jgi:hypothetical protein
MLPDAFVEHQLPGRARLRIPSKRGDNAFFHEAKQRLSGVSIIEEVSANPHIGTLLIRYAGEMDALKSEASSPYVNMVQPSKSRCAEPRRSEMFQRPSWV